MSVDPIGDVDTHDGPLAPDVDGVRRCLAAGRASTGRLVPRVCFLGDPLLRDDLPLERKERG